MNVDQQIAGALLKPDAALPHVIKGKVSKRFSVYRNNVTVGLVRALEANFPAVRRLLGPVYFAGLAREFAQLHPPQSPLMFYFGESFSAYLESQGDLAEFPYLADVARLEQQWRVSYHAADAPVLDPDQLSALGPDQMMEARFTAHPAAAVLTSAYSIHEIFVANRGEETQAFATMVAEDVVVSRPAHDVLVFKLGAGQAKFLSSLIQGASFGAAAEVAFDAFPEFDLANAIGTMLTSGAFTSISMQQGEAN